MLFLLGSPPCCAASQMCLTRLSRGEGSSPLTCWWCPAQWSPGCCWPLLTGPLLAHVHLVPSSFSAFHSTGLQPVLVQGMLEFALPFVQMPGVPVTPFLQPTKDPLNGGAAPWCGSHPSWYQHADQASSQIQIQVIFHKIPVLSTGRGVQVQLSESGRVL